MERRHARYPFLEAARNAVAAAGVDLAALAADGGPAVVRGRERVQRALLEGTTETEAPRASSDRTELLSYPVARVLVSLLEIPGAVEKYAAAEAATARARFVSDFESDMELKSVGDRRLALDRLLADFGLSGEVEPVGDGRFDVAVTAYLRLTGSLEGEEWRLVRRPLADGTVPVDRPELYTVLREAVRRRVAEGLPLSVPEAIAAALDDELSAVRRSVADIEPPMEFETVAPGLFPPCIEALVTRAREGETLPSHSRFALVSFLVAVGLDAEAVTALCDGAPADDDVESQVARLRNGDGGVAAPPSCAVMVEYGDCVNKDALCETIPHPLSYYEANIERTPDDRIDDSRA